jgi:hypothetical protein
MSHYRNQHTVSAWGPAQDAELRQLFSTMTTVQLAAHFKRGVRSIEKATRRLGISKAAVVFTPEEHALVAEFYPSSGTKHLVTIMSRSAKVLNDYAHRHNIFYTPWAPELEEKLRLLVAQGISSRLIAPMLGKSRTAIEGCKRRLGITTPPRVKAVKVARVKKDKVAKEPRQAKPKAVKAAAPKPEKAPVMRVVKIHVNAPDYRSKHNQPCGKKRTTVPFEGSEKLTDFLHSLPAKHLYRRYYEILTRPTAKRRFMKFTHEFFAACQEEGLELLTLQQAA